MNKTVKFELAKLLKEKRFDLPTNKHYEHALTSKKDSETNDYTGAFGWKKGETNLQSGYFKNNCDKADFSSKNWYMCSAPTIAEVIMWLYDEFGIWIVVNIDMNDKWYFELYNLKDKRNAEIPINEENISYFNDTPKAAYESAIEHTLNNLI